MSFIITCPRSCNCVVCQCNPQKCVVDIVAHEGGGGFGKIHVPPPAFARVLVAGTKYQNLALCISGMQKWWSANCSSTRSDFPGVPKHGGHDGGSPIPVPS